MIGNNTTAIMYGLNPENPSDLLIEYLIKSNEQGVKSLLMGFGIMADTQSKQILGLRSLIASGDESVICKVIGLDPNTDIHEEAFKRKYQKELNVHPVQIEKEKHSNSVENSMQAISSISAKKMIADINMMELLIFLICVFVLVKLIKS